VPDWDEPLCGHRPLLDGEAVQPCDRRRVLRDHLLLTRSKLSPIAAYAEFLARNLGIMRARRRSAADESRRPECPRAAHARRLHESAGGHPDHPDPDPDPEPCGACHKAAGGPRANVEAAPASGGSVEARLRRHVWATERLWEGIVVPSDASWKLGADGLLGEPFRKRCSTPEGSRAERGLSFHGPRADHRREEDAQRARTGLRDAPRDLFGLPSRHAQELSRRLSPIEVSGR